jgi:hypothetical protein
MSGNRAAEKFDEGWRPTNPMLLVPYLSSSDGVSDPEEVGTMTTEADVSYSSEDDRIPTSMSQADTVSVSTSNEGDVEFPVNDEAAELEGVEAQSKEEDNEGDRQSKNAEVLLEGREDEDTVEEAGKGMPKDNENEKEDYAEEWEVEGMNDQEVYKEREDEEEEEEVTNSAQQLSNVTFVAGRKIKDKRSILVDGYKYRYRKHQANKQKTRSWYCCLCWNNSGCRSTAVLDMANNTLMKVTAPHNHGSYFLRNFVRYILFYCCLALLNRELILFLSHKILLWYVNSVLSFTLYQFFASEKSTTIQIVYSGFIVIYI